MKTAPRGIIGRVAPVNRRIVVRKPPEPDFSRRATEEERGPRRNFGRAFFQKISALGGPPAPSVALREKLSLGASRNEAPRSSGLRAGRRRRLRGFWG